MSARAFEGHAAEIVSRPEEFGRWELAHHEILPCLQKYVLSLQTERVLVRITPGPLYPRQPPDVITKPRWHDQCFDEHGKLMWATVSQSNRNAVWTVYGADENPLALLIDELRRKYHVF